MTLPTLKPLTTYTVRYPEARQPEDYDREYLLDVAAAGCQSPCELTGSQEHVGAICALLGELDIGLRNLGDQLEISHGVGAKAWADLLQARDLLADERLEVRRLRNMLAVRDSELHLSQRLGLAFQKLILTVTGKSAAELQQQLDSEAAAEHELLLAVGSQRKTLTVHVRGPETTAYEAFDLTDLGGEQ